MELHGPEVEAFLLLMCVYLIFASPYVDSAPEVEALVGVFCCKVRLIFPAAITSSHYCFILD